MRLLPKFLLKFLLLLLIMYFSGCGFLSNDREIIDMDKLEKILSGKFEGLEDILYLFPKSSKDVELRTEKCIRDARQGVENILKISPEKRTFDNTVRALDAIEARFSIGSNSIEVFEMISKDKDIRKSCHESSIRLHEFAIDAFAKKELYQAFKEYVDNNFENENLTQEESYFLSEIMKDFVRQGFALPEQDFLEVKKLKKEIGKLSLQFNQNINTDRSFIEVSRRELDGLKEEFINNLEKTEDGRFILRCDYPTRSEILANCLVGATREKYYKMFMNRAYPENIDILNSVIEKRDQLAKKLGFESFSALSLDSQMVKSLERAEGFLNKLLEKTIKKMDTEFEFLTKNLPKGVELDSKDRMKPWDYYFVKTEYKKKNFNVDERVVAKYFPVDNTLKKIFEIYQNFLGLEFRNVDVDDLWDKNVRVINIYEQKDEKYIGTLFLDLYPRENKYPHACMVDLINTIKGRDFKTGEELDVPGVVLVIANFPKATKEKPALLKHSDVVTFFHEFGHAMHGFLGKTELFSNSGTSVKRDFVEMPSQMFEEWMWDKGILKMVSSHYKTGESLPEELIDKKLELKNLTSGFFVTRQCWLSLLSLRYFDRGMIKDTQQIKLDLHESCLKNTVPILDTYFQASFGHLMGYGAKYYGYMWAKVFSLDLFDRVKSEGLLNVQAGEKLKKLILGKGASVDPEVLLENYLGRKPSQEAFLRDLGIS